MNLIVELIFYSLVAFRISELLVIDEGPFEIFMSLRGWANGAPFDNSMRRNVANVLECVHCTGMWVSLLLGILYYFFHVTGPLTAILFAIATAGLQSILANKLGRSS